MLNQLAQERLELQNQAIYNLGQLCDLWQNRPTLDNPNFIERYLDCTFRILIKLRVGTINKEIVAHLQRKEVIGGIEPEVNGRDRFVRPHLLEGFGHKILDRGTNVDAFELASGSYQEAVFVDIVKSINEPERVIPTFVWLDFVDSLYGRLRHSLYFSHLSGFVFFGAIKDRERDVSERIVRPLGVSDPIGANKDKLVSQVVQGASEAVNDVSETQRDIKMRRGDLRNIIMQLSGLRIALGSEFVGVGFERGPTDGERLQLVDVLIGPCNFRSD